MKIRIKMSFESVEKFVDFILCANFVRIRIDPLEMKSISNSCYDSFQSNCIFWDSLSEVEIEDKTYSVRCVNDDWPANLRADYDIMNYLVNDVQIKAETIFIRSKAERKTEGGLRGIDNIKKKLLKGLPNIFSLQVGWRTDYDTYLFEKN